MSFTDDPDFAVHFDPPTYGARALNRIAERGRAHRERHMHRRPETYGDKALRETARGLFARSDEPSGTEKLLDNWGRGLEREAEINANPGRFAADLFSTDKDE